MRGPPLDSGPAAAPKALSPVPARGAAPGVTVQAQAPVAGSFSSPQNWQRFGSATTGGGGAGVGAGAGPAGPLVVTTWWTPSFDIAPSIVQPCFFTTR